MNKRHMWQKEQKDTSIVNLTLLLALATVPIAAILITRQSVLAQSATSVLSSAVSKEDPSNKNIVRIDGSIGMAGINQALKESFEKQFSGAKVEFATSSTEAALQALRKGKIDIAAISRDLTPEEETEGLQQVHVHREKIAIIVGKNNPFKDSLTSKKFAKIFRGEITNWSQLGGTDDKIRFIDRPTTSEVRDAFRNYPIFKTAKFGTGSTVIPLSEDSTPQIVKQLGKDGISYVLANQVPKLQGVRVLQMNHISPDDPRYPFSLASVYVYKKNPSPNVNNFLGFSIATKGQHAVEAVLSAQATDLASGKLQLVPAGTNSLSTNGSPPSADGIKTSKETSPTNSSNDQDSNLAEASHSSNSQSLATFHKNINAEKLTPLLWWLLPLFAFCGFLLWWLRGRRSAESRTETLLQLAANIPLKEVSTTHISSGLGKKEQQKPRDLVEKQTQTTHVSNKVEDLTPAGDVLAVDNSSPLWLKFFNAGSDTKETNNSTDRKDLRSNEVLADEPTEDHLQTTDQSLTQVNVPQTLLDLEAPVTVVNSKYPELPDMPIITSDVIPKQADTQDIQSKVTEEHASLDNPNIVPDRLVDPSESSGKTTETETEEISTKQEPTIAAASTPTVVTDSTLTAIDTVQASNNSTNKPEVIADQQITHSPKAESENQIVLESRTSKWGYAFWKVSDSEKKALQQQGGSQLVLRLYDVTDIDLSYQNPKLIQQYECEEMIYDRYVAIPKSDRDYIAEIGYVTNDKRWLLLARSEIVHVCEHPAPDFWFVADAELIIHGAAEPGSKVAIDGDLIKVRPDGTFHLRIPFTDKLMNYAMTAVAANGEHSKTIKMNFSQENSDGK